MRLLKAPGSISCHARMLAADFDGVVRDGATFKLRGSPTELADGDMVMFYSSDGIGPGINVEEDDKGLCTHVQIEPACSFRFGLEKVSEGEYSFRPGEHHKQLIPALAQDGTGIPLRP